MTDEVMVELAMAMTTNMPSPLTRMIWMVQGHLARTTHLTPESTTLSECLDRFATMDTGLLRLSDPKDVRFEAAMCRLELSRRKAVRINRRKAQLSVS
jgi:hypothetical protein